MATGAGAGRAPERCVRKASSLHSPRLTHSALRGTGKAYSGCSGGVRQLYPRNENAPEGASALTPTTTGKAFSWTTLLSGHAPWLEIQRGALCPVWDADRHGLEDANERHHVGELPRLGNRYVDAMGQ